MRKASLKKKMNLLGVSLLLILCLFQQTRICDGLTPFSLRSSSSNKVSVFGSSSSSSSSSAAATCKRTSLPPCKQIQTFHQHRNVNNNGKINKIATTKSTALQASITANDDIGQQLSNQKESSTASDATTSTSKTPRVSLTSAIAYVYLATVFTMTLIPVILMPVVATIRCSSAATTSASAVAAAASGMVAAIASISTLGGAVGRFVNGFVIQILGGKPSSSSYLVGLAGLVALFGSLNPLHTPQVAYATVLAGMEFCYSIQWAAALYILSNHYLTGNPQKDGNKFATSVTSISLASTVGILGAKAIGPTLLQMFSPRMVAYLGSAVALSGAVVMNRLVQERPDATTSVAEENNKKKEPFTIRENILQPLKIVGGSKLFWFASIGHGITYLARQADRILGSFFQEVSGLPTSLCAGLTASITLGFVHGLVTATKKWPSLKTPEQQNRFFMQRYVGAVLSCLGLALTSIPSFMNMLGLSPALKAGLVALVSGALASSISYQFYQFPPLVGNMYGKNKAVVTSWFNGMGFFIAAPVWAITSRIVDSSGATTAATAAAAATVKIAGLTLPGGWALAWSMIAVLFGVAGMLQTKLVLPNVLNKQE